MGILVSLYVRVYMTFAVNAILNLLSLCTYSPDHNDEEDEDSDVESSQDRTFFVVEESSRSFYRQQDAASLERDIESVELYPTLAFAESANRPLAFNFNLFVLDRLALPRHIVPPDSREVSKAVLFNNAVNAISYCTETIRVLPLIQLSGQDRRHTYPKVNKWELFRTSDILFLCILFIGHFQKVHSTDNILFSV